MKREHSERKFALCVENKDCADLEKRKVYRVLPDKSAAKEDFIRVIDESGEDYLCPASCFTSIKVPAAAAKSLLLSS